MSISFTAPWRFRARKNVPLEEVLSNVIRKTRSHLPIIHIRGQLYLIGAAKCIVSLKSDVIFVKNTNTGLLTASDRGTHLAVKLETFLRDND